MITDSMEPRRSRQKPDKAKRIANQGGRPLPQLIDVYVRFIYENELKGEWFPVSGVFILSQGIEVSPNPHYKVVRLEFKDNKNC